MSQACGAFSTRARRADGDRRSSERPPRASQVPRPPSDLLWHDPRQSAMLGRRRRREQGTQNHALGSGLSLDDGGRAGRLQQRGGVLTPQTIPVARAPSPAVVPPPTVAPSLSWPRGKSSTGSKSYRPATSHTGTTSPTTSCPTRTQGPTSPLAWRSAARSPGPPSSSPPRDSGLGQPPPWRGSALPARLVPRRRSCWRPAWQ